MKQTYLLVGDLHAQINNLEDTGIILDAVAYIVRQQNVQFTVFLGDVYHTHSVMRQEVVKLLQDKLLNTRGAGQGKPIIIVGNHDLVGPTNLASNACDLTLSDVAAVVSEPLQVNDILLMPFIPDNEVFIQLCNQYPDTTVLICHQTFDGSVYENGFYAPEGVDQKLIPQKYVLAGHIHKAQTIGKVKYVGTPRALTAAEHNEDKGVTIVTYDTELKTLDTKFISLNSLVKTYIHLDIKQDSFNADQLLSMRWKPKDSVSIHLYGTEEFCDEINSKIIPALKASSSGTTIKTIPHITRNQAQDKQIDITTESLKDALHRYVMTISPVKNEIREDIWETIQKEMNLP